MPTHMNKRQRKIWWERIEKKQRTHKDVGGTGEFCNRCGAIHETLIMNDKQLIIHHIDNIPTHNVIDNLEFRCRACNYLDNPRDSGLPQREMTQSELKNRQTENRWRAWVVEKVMNYNGYEVHEAIYSGGELFNISPATIERRWLKKLTSSAGPLSDKQINEFGEPILTLKGMELPEQSTLDEARVER